jgi:hypothetical protein
MMRKAVFGVALCLLATTAWATDFTAVLSGLDGKPLVAEGVPSMTLGEVVANALVNQFKDENPSGQDKVKRWALALRIHAAKDIELTADEVKLIKDLVAKAYGPLVVGQVWSILDPASVK